MLGVRLNAFSVDESLDIVADWISEREAGAPPADHGNYVCHANVHSLMEAQDDPALMAALNESALSVPDGMPLVWASKYAGHKSAERVYGPDLLDAVAAKAATEGWTSFFMGGADGVADSLVTTLQERFPGFTSVGTMSPPYRELSEAENQDMIDTINDAKPDLLWVGLGMPKQEKWMHAHAAKIEAAGVFGVGAAFDFGAGTVRQAPKFIQRSGFEWLFRLAMEPRRLWRRYLVTCSPFFLALAKKKPTISR